MMMKHCILLFVFSLVVLLNTNSAIAVEKTINCMPLLNKYIVANEYHQTHQEIELRNKIIKCITSEKIQLNKLAANKKIKVKKKGIVK